jgi:hypothetical protein
MSSDRPRLELISWKPLTKGSLRGFATVMLPIGLKIVDCPVFVGDNGPWATLPQKPELDREGKRRTDSAGKPLYGPVLEWRNRDLSGRFSAAVVALVENQLEGNLKWQTRTQPIARPSIGSPLQLPLEASETAPRLNQ